MSDTDDSNATQSDYDSEEEELAREQALIDKRKAELATKERVRIINEKRKAKGTYGDDDPSPYGETTYDPIDMYVPNNDFLEELERREEGVKLSNITSEPIEELYAKSDKQLEFDEEERLIAQMYEEDEEDGLPPSPDWNFTEEVKPDLPPMIGDTDSESDSYESEDLEDIVNDDILSNNQQQIERLGNRLQRRHDWEDIRSKKEQEALPERFTDLGLSLQNERVIVKKEFIKTARGLDLVRQMKSGFMTKEDKLEDAKKKQGKAKEEALRKKFNKATTLWKETAQARNLREKGDQEIYAKYGTPDENRYKGDTQARDDYALSFLQETSDEDSDDLEEVSHTTFNPKTKETDRRMIKEPKSIFTKEKKYTELDDAITQFEGGETAFYKAPPSPPFRIAEADTLNAIRSGLQPVPIRTILPQRWEGDDTTLESYERSRDQTIVGENEPMGIPLQLPKNKGAGGLIDNPNFDKERYDKFIKDSYNFREASGRDPKQTKYKKPEEYIGTSLSQVYRQPVAEIINPIIEEPQSEYDDDDLSDLGDFGLDDEGEEDDISFSRPDTESRGQMGKGKGKYKGEVHLNFPNLPKSAYEFTTEGKSYGEETKSFLEQQRDAMLKMRQPITNVPITSMFPKDDFGYTIDATKKGSQVGKAGTSFDPRYVEERKEKEREKAEQRKARREEQLEDEYVEDRMLFNTKRKEFDKATTKRREATKKEKKDDLSKTPNFSLKRRPKPKEKPKEKSPSPPPTPVATPPKAPPRKRRGMKTRPRPPSPPPKKSGFQTRPARKKPPSPSPSPSPSPPPKDKDPPLPRGGKRVRGVRSDKGTNHKWSDGRESSSTYKANKAKGVDWSSVRCRASTCWKIGDRLEDKKGKGAYKANKSSGEYKEQLRKPKKKKKKEEERTEANGWF